MPLSAPPDRARGQRWGCLASKDPPSSAALLLSPQTLPEPPSPQESEAPGPRRGGRAVGTAQRALGLREPDQSEIRH